jgi:hypothetical protein
MRKNMVRVCVVACVLSIVFGAYVPYIVVRVCTYIAMVS